MDTTDIPKTPPIYATFNGKGGFDIEREHARQQLTLGKRYEVVFVDMGQSSTILYLKGVTLSYTSALFDVDFDALRKMTYTQPKTPPGY